MEELRYSGGLARMAAQSTLYGISSSGTGSLGLFSRSRLFLYQYRFHGRDFSLLRNPTELSLSVLVKRHGVGGYWTFFHALLILTSLAPKGLLGRKPLHIRTFQPEPLRDKDGTLENSHIQQAHRAPPEVAVCHPSELHSVTNVTLHGESHPNREDFRHA